MFREVRFEASAGLRGAAGAYVRACGSSAAPMTDRSGRRGRRLELELGHLLRREGARVPLAFARANRALCGDLVRRVVGALPGVLRDVGRGPSHRVYVSLIAVAPLASAQEVHADAGDKARGSYTTVIVPLTRHAGQGTTEFLMRDGSFSAPAPGAAYAFDGRAMHRGGANLSRAWRVALCVVVCKGADPNRLAGGSLCWTTRL